MKASQQLRLPFSEPGWKKYSTSPSSILARGEQHHLSEPNRFFPSPATEPSCPLAVLGLLAQCQGRAATSQGSVATARAMLAVSATVSAS